MNSCIFSFGLAINNKNLVGSFDIHHLVWRTVIHKSILDQFISRGSYQVGDIMS